MRSIAALCLALTLAACSGPSRSPQDGSIGRANFAALNAAASCRNSDALALAKGAESTPRPSERLFAVLAQAAILEDMGRAADAEAAIETATTDPALNPAGAPRSEMETAAAALRESIVQQREATTGSTEC